MARYRPTWTPPVNATRGRRAPVISPAPPALTTWRNSSDTEGSFAGSTQGGAERGKRLAGKRGRRLLRCSSSRCMKKGRSGRGACCRGRRAGEERRKRRRHVQGSRASNRRAAHRSGLGGCRGSSRRSTNWRRSSEERGRTSEPYRPRRPC